jgi:lipopolysaccharide/colanic/teichoic acid biosynthesis glycosyltransferase
MTWQKRLCDVVLSLVLIVLLSPVILLTALAIRLRDGSPILYASERMRTPSQSIRLWKFRTISVAPTDRGVTGGDKTSRITRLGRALRGARIDELPQLFNVLIGDISLVGPRPPLRMYVDAAPDLYEQVLRSRPGITGLASLYYHEHEARILAACASSSETDAAYRRRCVPAKARLDLIYQRHASVCFDFWILWRTVAKVWGGSTRRHRGTRASPVSAS